ncbi:MAG TPA: hypothetical protein VMM38_02485 [Aridibacter sp.]|nr:hypothetical protein [Aridibacter sp.]
MIEKICGPLAFAAALAIGVSVSSLIPDASDSARLAFESVAEPLGFAPVYKTTPDGRVEIKFIGESMKSGRAYLDFRVINRSESTVTYWSSLGEGPENFILEVSGQEQDMLWCGNGQKERTLYPGYAVDVSIYRLIIDDLLPARGGEVRIGYYFKFGGDRSEKVFADSIRLKPGEKTKKKQDGRDD